MLPSAFAPSEPGSECPTPSILRVVEAAWRYDTTSSTRLSAALCLSAATIDTYFERAMRCARVHDRGGAIIVAVKCGWVKLDEVKTSPPAAAKLSPAVQKKRTIRGKKRKCRQSPT